MYKRFFVAQSLQCQDRSMGMPSQGLKATGKYCKAWTAFRNRASACRAAEREQLHVLLRVVMCSYHSSLEGLPHVNVPLLVQEL
jgi:hypothetical protein